MTRGGGNSEGSDPAGAAGAGPHRPGTPKQRKTISESFC